MLTSTTGSEQLQLLGIAYFAALLGESGPYVDRATNAVTVLLGA